MEFITIDDRPPIDIAPLTAGYDFFLNTSYMDYFPSFARHSAMLIYFPGKLDPKRAWGRQLKLLLRRWFKLPAIMVGIQAFHPEGPFFRWETDNVLIVRLPPSASPYIFRFQLSARDQKVTGSAWRLDGQPAGAVRLPSGGEPVACEVQVPGATSSAHHELIFEAGGDVRLDGKPKMEISHPWLSLAQFRLYHNLVERRLRGISLRLQYYPPGYSILDYADTYSMLWANSEFTRRWIRAYWNRDSQVLYPLVNTAEYKPQPKRCQILNVGRFFAGQHNKKHHIMVEAFKSMVDGGLAGWELHLAGGSTPGEEHAEYLADIERFARGYPISLHPDISGQELVNLYAASAIYWHASGYAEDEKHDPDKFEHFGITTVEAMAAGCVPVVIGKGGQPEIVEHGTSGYLWNDLDELKALSLHLIGSPEQREKMSAAALAKSKTYDKEHFRARLDLFLSQIGFKG
jgi:glycosyltransferase involved in cell wall biosynthesis